MKYAKIKNGKVVDVINGLAPDDYVEVIRKWEAPTDYPVSFYNTSSNQPIVTVVDDVPTENWTFTLKPIEQIKDDVMELQKSIRQKKQLESFDFGGVEIVLGERETSIIISCLPETDVRYKVKSGVWVTMTGAQVIAFKEAHRVHVQAAYDWEEAENIAIAALTTYDEINTYLDTLSEA